ncbi:hypothetical protein [Nocardia sp. CNY236]|uniref:hypothetical protein n=1 Tax=Nocardia sp. CNY236 TaxID=1169152 RepID=UPI0003FB5696|nr:hypothetical protein [Nocardia sp. CNY236]
MVNYGEEARRLSEENRRRMAMLLEEIHDVTEQTAAASREFADRLAADMDQLRAERAEQTAHSGVEVEEKQRPEAAAWARRAAIARSVAARKATDLVTPVDEQDEETEFYQRKSWLI